MITSPDLLRKETVACLTQINKVIEEIEEEAKRVGLPPHKMRDSSNNFVLAPMLLAKVMAIHTLTDLNSNLQSRGSRRN